MEQSETQEAVNSYKKAVNEFNALRVRLDTAPLIEQIELYMRGSKYVMNRNEEGNISIQQLSVGRPKANDSGIQTLLNWISGTINAQTVQGNFPVDKHGYSQAYENYIYEYQIELTKTIIINCYNWGIDDSELQGIISFVMMLVIPFMSRLIGNKERESYYETLKSIETTGVKVKGGGIQGFIK